jgi:flagellar basal-body rod protein FlgF
MKTIEIAAIGLQQDSERLRVVSHNVANLATPGYKRQVVVHTPFADTVNAVQSGYTATDVSAGKLRTTGNLLDVALSEREFLLVQAAAGSMALSKGGSLHIDGQGRLVTAGGHAVQGLNGEIVAPVTAQDVRIDVGGAVYADNRRVGALQVIKLPSNARIAPLGDGLFAFQSSDVVPVATPAVQPGRLEASNVAPSQEMVQVMMASRHAESMARLIQGADEALEKTIRKLGELS